MIHKKVPALGGNRVAGWDRTGSSNSTPRSGRCKSIEAAAVLVAGEGLDAERRLVAAG